MVPPHWGFDVNRNHTRAPSRWAVILLAAAALTLGACGRKAGLDLPPNASAQADTAVETARAAPSVFNPSYGVDAPPVAAKGRNRPFILDPLLND
jgi:predicted small lipoprotein YifL